MSVAITQTTERGASATPAGDVANTSVPSGSMSKLPAPPGNDMTGTFTATAVPDVSNRVQIKPDRPEDALREYTRNPLGSPAADAGLAT